MRWLLATGLLMLQMGIFAQWPACPTTGRVNWETSEDFARAQDTVKRVAKWLCDTPLSWAFEDRTRANAYVLQWMVNHPERKWETQTACFGPIEEEMDLMYAYLQAILYYSLMHEKQHQEIQDLFVIKVLSEKILQSEKYAHRGEWKKMTRAYRRHREKKYLMRCYKNN